MLTGIVFIFGVICGVALRDFITGKGDLKSLFPNKSKNIEPTNLEEYGSNRQTPPPFLF